MIKLLVLLLVMVVVIGVPVIAVRSLLSRGPAGPLTGRGRQLALERATWQAFTDVRHDGTTVGIRKVLSGRGTDETVGEMALAEIAGDDPDWEVAVSQAMLAARVRADVLNAEERRAQGDG